MARWSLPVLAVWAAWPAGAAEIACRFEAGVLTAPALVAGIAGDYILDTGEALTTLDETQARAAGLAEAGARGEVRLAGLATPDRPIRIAPLDVRTWNLPTPVSGVIGADLLQAYVVDVAFSPCRVRITRPGAAPAFRGTRLALSLDAGRATARAAVSDGAHEIEGRFVIATGMNAPLRLADDLAAVPGAPRPAELSEAGVWLARLPRVAFAGSVGRDVAAGLMTPKGEAVGALGGQVLANFRLRFDFPAGELTVAPAE